METNQIESPLGSGCLHAGVKKCCWPSGSPSARRGGWAAGERAGELRCCRRPGRGSAASSLRAGKEMLHLWRGKSELSPASRLLLFFSFFLSFLFFLPCLVGILIKGGGGMEEGDSTYFAKLAAALRRALPPPPLRGDLPGPPRPARRSGACGDRVCWRCKSAEGMRRFPGDCHDQQDTSGQERWWEREKGRVCLEENSSNN